MTDKGLKAVIAFVALLAVTYLLNDLSLRAAKLEKTCADRQAKITENRILLEIQSVAFLVAGGENEIENKPQYSAEIDKISKLEKEHDFHCNQVDEVERDISRLQIASNIFAAIFGLLAGVWLTEGTSNNGIVGATPPKARPKTRSRKKQDVQ